MTDIDASPRRRGTLLVVGGVLALVVLLALSVGGTLWFVSGSAAQSGLAASRRSVATGAPAVPTAPPVDLLTVILKKPVGSDPFPSTGWSDGRLTVDQAAAIEYEDPKGGRSYLLQVGFVEGAAVGWSRTGERVKVLLYRFELETYASDWMHASMQNLPDALDGSETLDAPLNGGTFFALTKPTGAGALYPSLAYLYKGPIVITVFVATRTKAATHTMALDLLRRQYDRLA